MSTTIRYIKVAMIASIALFFSIVAYNNLIDFTSNLPALQHVLSMDTTFGVPIFMRRAITNSGIQWTAYGLIVTWEMLTAILCWLGCVRLLRHIHTNDTSFYTMKTTALLGLFCGFLLYMVGFIIIGSEWFCMWQSPDWNAQSTAGLFVSLILFVMLFIQQKE